MKRKNPLLATTALSVLLGAASPGAHAALTDDLIVHLTFDNTFNDASGRGNHGTPVVQPEIDTGIPVTVADGSLIGSHALRLGTGQHVRLGDFELTSHPDLQFGDSTDFSISLWVRGNTGAWAGDPPFFSNKSWTSGENIGYVISTQGSGGWKWNYTGDAASRLDTPSFGSVADGAWHNIIVVHDRDGLATFYVDGAQISTMNIAGTGSIDTFIETNIGNDGTGRYGFDSDTGSRFSEAFFDDVAVWRRALTPVEVSIIYGGGLQGFNVQEADSVAVVVSRLFPSPGATDAPAVGDVVIEFSNISGAVDKESIEFFFDGEMVAADVEDVGNITRVSYTIPERLAAGSEHTVRVEAMDDATPAGALEQEWTFTVAQYVTLAESSALPAGSATTSGIRAKTYWASEAVGGLATTIARAEAQIAGTLLDPFSGLPYFNSATPGLNPDGSTTVPVLNFEQAATPAGRIGGDTAFPGLDLPGDYNNLAIEAIAYLDLDAGYYRFGVNSDDGFEVRTGLPARSVLGSQVLGSFDGGRGAGDTVFDFIAPVDGIYPFRLIFFEGTGGASLEWWSLDLATGNRVLINDPANADSIKSFAFSSAVDQLAFVRSVVPAPGEESARMDSPIELVIVDGTTPVAVGTVKLSIDGTEVDATVTKEGDVTTVSYLADDLSFKTMYEATVVFGSGASEVSNSWTFTTRGFDQPPAITGQWNFEGNLKALIGTDIEYPNNAVRTITQFGTSDDFGIPGIGGEPAHVMYFPGSSSPDLYYDLTHGAAPNANGTLVNRWTVIMDVFYPETNTGTWFSFMQIDSLANSGDGELFVNFSDRTGDGIPDGGIGIGGAYTNTEGNETYIQRGQWHRVVFAVDQTNDNEFGEGVLSKFIDGMKFQDQLRGETFDGRHALRNRFLLFADEDGESQPVYVSSVQVRNYKMTDAEVAALGGVGSAAGIPTVSGQWDFNAGTLDATLGSALMYRGDTETVTTFSADTIDGASANVMGFPGTTPAQGYYAMPGVLANGGGDFANQYTLIMDIKFPTASNGTWRGLWQTDTNNVNDGELFVNTGNGIGISGDYKGTIVAETWHRVAFAIDMTKPELAKYIDGELVGTQELGGGIDGRFAAGNLALLFADESDETAPGFVNSIQIRPLQLSAEQIAALGGATAAGIPLDLPYFPTIVEEDVPDVAVELLANGQVRITWEAGAGLTLQQSPSLTNPTWTAVPDVTGNSATLDAAGAEGFFRLSR